ncbi:MAG: PLP-dependent aminotransferase family protein [Clostridiales Family XIII bacterium]|jgi:2-aminoadipate transaminase|nr:PLP-dependent aminotransferase family protein [Clostridiales Family XIII bacterium]
MSAVEGLRFAKRIGDIMGKSHDLVELMGLSDAPGIISFAGGFPSPETYPIEDIKETMAEIMREDAAGALSYSSPSGYYELREQIAARMRKNFGLQSRTEEILLVSGSQQGLDLSGLLFIDPGDVVIFETPSYLGALSALKTYEARLVAVGSDEEGMCMDALERAFETYGDRIKLIYVNPDYQNPTGRSWSASRRDEFVAFAERKAVAVIEDAAYAELSYSGEKAKPLISYSKKGFVIYLGTFSKTFCPGLRTGWICCARELLERYLALKANVDLSPATILHRQLSHYLKTRDLDAHIGRVGALYKRRRDIMHEAVRNEFPAEATYSLPGGGLFFWVKLPDRIDSRELFARSVAENVAFMPGGAFYPNAERNCEMRLNFSNMPEGEIIKGIAVLGRLIKEM